MYVVLILIMWPCDMLYCVLQVDLMVYREDFTNANMFANLGSHIPQVSYNHYSNIVHFVNMEIIVPQMSAIF